MWWTKQWYDSLQSQVFEVHKYKILGKHSYFQNHSKYHLM